MNIQEIREKNIKELNTLELKKQQLAAEIKQLLEHLGLKEMPAQEFIENEIATLQNTLSERKANLETLVKKYEQLAAS